MVKNRKMSKTSVAIIVLALLLVFSLVMGMTGAWFTDSKAGSAVPVTLGTIEISSNQTTAAISITMDDEVAMPGDAIAVTGIIKNSGTGKAWVRYKVTHNYETAGALKTALDGAFSGNYVYVAAAVDADGSVTFGSGSGQENVSLTIPTTLPNVAQGATFNLTLVVEAVQWANNNSGLTCQQAFEAVLGSGNLANAVPARA